VELHVISVGKLKSPALDELCEEWTRRSGRLALPIRREAVRDAAAQWVRARALGGPIVALDERGTEVDSPGLAAWLARWRDDGVRAVAFLVGDAHGHAAADRASATRVLSLSRLTLPHRLAHVVLVEQLYRAATILAGHPYHHAD
jgi:23S rRNA (pseudouridine1915-N3)-methyltransferase